MSPLLFSPFKLRALELPNRIVVSPMAQYSAVDGLAGEWHLMHLGNLSVSGAGLFIIEATSVERDARLSPGDLGLWSEAHEAALRPIIAFCRKHGTARIGLQLQHAGRKGSVNLAWQGQKDIPIDAGGWEITGADEIAYPGRPKPRKLDAPRIQALLQSYADAAKRADNLGIDLLEIHAAHGYLLHNFLSPLSNQRSDEFGASSAGRMKFVLAVFEAVRNAWPEQKPLGVRISATDWVDGGWDIDDSVELAARLKALGCDYITASSGGTVPEQKIEVKPNYQVPFAERIRRDAGIATMAVGLITEPRQAEDILAQERADLIAIGRGILYNPRWPWHAAAALGATAAYPPQYERSHPSMRRGDFLKARRDA
ncbi:MAG: NADH:flavin oxidoreductase/NADH oxidase [Rhizobiales bacterium]|nr:NADH:flavin oxidoreductase/NADH oxidase [Hyphomicrobiales bacterium]